jgi:hypothetical protein
VHIGDIVMASQFTTSNFGDRYFFIKHQDIRDDLKLRPDWESSENKYECPFKWLAQTQSFLGL